MKIIVEFIRAEQHWNPDTGAQQNFLVFGFAGREHKIPCEEQDIIQAIRSAPHGTRAAAPADEDEHAGAFAVSPNPEYSEGEGPDELEQEMLGGLDENQALSNPPVTFENPVETAAERPKSDVDQRKEMIEQGLASRPRSRASILKEKNDRMRAVAKLAPMRTIAAGEGGNPDVPESQQLAGPVPTVKRVKRPETKDDDRFEQG
jgi:hypothetical protein